MLNSRTKNLLCDLDTKNTLLKVHLAKRLIWRHWMVYTWNFKHWRSFRKKKSMFSKINQNISYRNVSIKVPTEIQRSKKNLNNQQFKFFYMKLFYIKSTKLNTQWVLFNHLSKFGSLKILKVLQCQKVSRKVKYFKKWL